MATYDPLSGKFDEFISGRIAALKSTTADQNSTEEPGSEPDASSQMAATWKKNPSGVKELDESSPLVSSYRHYWALDPDLYYA